MARPDLLQNCLGGDSLNTPTVKKSSAESITHLLSIIQLPASPDASGRNLHSTIPAFRLIDGQLGQVKKLIKGQLTAPAKTPYINQLLEYVNARSGKMIRPGLVLLAGASCGKIIGEHVRVAAIIEMIHNTTLLHDDVIDEGRTRRGLPTINSVWGNQSAVLLGDFLLSRVFKMCSDLEPWIARVVSAAAVRVCEGELRQITQRQNWQISEPQYLDIITEKTAVLFGCCCHLGGLLSRASQTEVQALADFGLNAGIAFQITDDLLDIVGDESKMGKTLGSDADKNKLTLAVIHLLKVTDEKERATIINSYLGNSQTYPEQDRTRDELAELLNRHGSLKYAHEQASRFAAKAIQALAKFKDSAAKNALIETAKFMASRTT
jgi:octaprenyl-diphosphate synthase